MKRFLLVFTVFLSLVFTSQILASTETSARLLLIEATDKIDLHNAVFDFHTNDTYLTSSSQDRVYFALDNSEYWQMDRVFSNYDATIAYGYQELGESIPWIAAYTDSWYIWIGDPDSNAVFDTNILTWFNNELGKIALYHPAIYISGSSGMRWLYAASTPLVLRDFTLQGVEVVQKKHSYPGSLQISIVGESMRLINQANIDDIVAGVIAREMSPSWPLEALKAQAVASRTVLLSRLTPEDSYDINEASIAYNGCDTMVLGAPYEAAMATKGEVALYGDQLIQATYHADAGGMTLNCEDVWHAPLPYLRSIKELFPSQGPDAAWSVNPSYTGWELSGILRTEGLGSIGQVLSIEQTEKTGLGKWHFIGSEGELYLKPSTVRQALNLMSNNFMISSSQNLTMRSSTMTQINEGGYYNVRSKSDTTVINIDQGQTIRTLNGLYTIPANSIGGENFTFSGSGWGHGVGLSQWGAKAMADNGYDYRDILYHYFTDITIALAWE